MPIAVFLTPAYIKSVTVVDENVDEKILKISIQEAQRVHIRKVLGSSLYNRLCDDVNAGTLAGDYKTLMDEFITPSLVQWTLYEAGLWLTYKYRNKSITTQNSENSQPVDLTIVQALRDEHKNKAELETNILRRYLIDNPDKFPEYDENLDTWDIQPERESFSSPIWTGRPSSHSYFKGKSDIIDLNG